MSIENLSLNKEYPEEVIVMLQENVGVEIQPLNSRSIEKYSGEESDVLELSENVIRQYSMTKTFIILKTSQRKREPTLLNH